jgi:hypothetical protein
MRSPLRIPESRGSAVRIVVSVCLLLVAGFVFFAVVSGIKSGEMYFSASGVGGGFTVSRADNPRGFWVAVIVICCLDAWLFYISVAEMIYTTRRKRDRL